MSLEEKISDAEATKRYIIDDFIKALESKDMIVSHYESRYGFLKKILNEMVVLMETNNRFFSSEVAVNAVCKVVYEGGMKSWASVSGSKWFKRFFSGDDSGKYTQINFEALDVFGTNVILNEMVSQTSKLNPIMADFFSIEKWGLYTASQRFLNFSEFRNIQKGQIYRLNSLDIKDFMQFAEEEVYKELNPVIREFMVKTASNIKNINISATNYTTDELNTIFLDTGNDFIEIMDVLLKNNTKKVEFKRVFDDKKRSDESIIGKFMKEANEMFNTTSLLIKNNIQLYKKMQKISFNPFLKNVIFGYITTNDEFEKVMQVQDIIKYSEDLKTKWDNLSSQAKSIINGYMEVGNQIDEASDQVLNFNYLNSVLETFKTIESKANSIIEIAKFVIDNNKEYFVFENYEFKNMDLIDTIRLYEKEILEFKKEYEKNEKMYKEKFEELNKQMKIKRELQEKKDEYAIKYPQILAENHKLIDEVEVLKDYYKSHEKDIEILSSNKAHLEKIVDKYEGIKKDLEDQVKKATEEFKKVASEKKELVDERNDIKKINEAIKNENEAIKEELERIKKANTEFVQTNKNLKDEIHTTKQLNENLLKKLTETENAVKTQEILLEKLSSAKSDIELRTKTLNDEIVRTQKQIKELQSEKMDVANELENVKRELEAKEIELNELKAAVEEQKTQNEEKRQEIIQIVKEKSELVKKLDEKELTLSKVLEQKQNFEKRLLEANTTIEDLKEDVKRFNEELEKNTIEKKRISEENAESRKKYTELFNSNGMLEHHFRTIESKVKEFENTIKKLELEKSQIEIREQLSSKKSAELLAEIKFISSKKKEEESAVNKDKEKLVAEITTLKQQMDSKLTMYSKLEKQMKEIEPAQMMVGKTRKRLFNLF